MIKLMNINKLTHLAIELVQPILLATLLTSMLILPLSVTAGIYKWVDEEGNVHYGSQRPENLSAEKLKIDVPKKSTETDPAKDENPEDGENPENEQTEEEKTEEATKPEEPEEPKMSRAEKKRLCSSARKRVAKIESRGRLKTTDDKGNVRFLSDTERNDRLKQARGDVKNYCR